jgi:hypothetical protein
MMADGRSWDDMDQIKRGWDMSFSYIYMVSRGRSGIPLVQDQQRLRLTGVLTSGRVARTGRVIHFGLISFRRSTVQCRWKAEQMWTTSRANPRTLAIWRPNLAHGPTSGVLARSRTAPHLRPISCLGRVGPNTNPRPNLIKRDMPRRPSSWPL